jgi:hydrogenase maturation protease
MRSRSAPLVLGIGNVLMGDEGVGVAVLNALSRESWPAEVTLLDGGTGGFHLLEYLQAHDPVVLIDAAMDGQPPGTVSVLYPRYAPDFPRALTAHDIGLRDLIEAAALLGPLPAFTLVTVSIDDIRPMTMVLSPAVEAAIEPAMAVVREVVLGQVGQVGLVGQVGQASEAGLDPAPSKPRAGGRSFRAAEGAATDA